MMKVSDYVENDPYCCKHQAHVPKNIARAAAVMHIVMRKQQIWSQAVSRRDYRALFKD
jgi:hypothetical protein